MSKSTEGVRMRLKRTFIFDFVLLTSLLFACSAVEAGLGFATIGAAINIAGETYTLKKIVCLGHIGIWQSSAGNYYEIESAVQKGNIRQVLTEVILSKDNTIIKRKVSYEFGDSLPNPDAKLRQVALIPKIVDGKIMDRSKIESNGLGATLVSGLVFYYKGDTAVFGGKDFTLTHFDNEKPIWKGPDNKNYIVEVSQHTTPADYVLRKVK